MKRYRGKDGVEKIWIEPSELEDMMTHELQKAKLMPMLDNPIVDLEKFVERHLMVRFDSYAELDPMVLGQTDFGPDGQIQILINRDLTGAALDDDESAPGTLGRWRATVAHEASHVLLHKSLFIVTKQPSLFEADEGDDPNGLRLQRCLKRDVTFLTVADWREVQANMGMAALLMPKHLFIAAVREELARAGIDRIDRGSREMTRLVAALAPRFQVSKQAASIRLDTFQLLSEKGQTSILG